MTDALEAELDRLFQLSPAELVPARNALAEALKKAGDRETAKGVMAIKRPTSGAWAINQVHFREPALLAHARDQAFALRELTAAAGSDARQLSAALATQRSATQEVVEAALRYCDAAGIAGGPLLQRKIFTNLQGWLSGKADERPGRMTRDLESSGFEAIESVGFVLPRASPPSAVDTATDPATHSARTGEAAEVVPPKPDPRELARANEQLAKCEREARTALDRASERAADRKQAELALERARMQLEDAERALVQLRSTVAQREATRAKAHAALAEAEQEQKRTAQAVVQAKAALATLTDAKLGRSSS